MTSDRIELGSLTRALARRDGRPGSRGCVIAAESADGRWLFLREDGAWTAVHVSGRVLTHAGSSLEMARASEARLLEELELVYGRLNARDRLVVAGICPCDPTHGQSCVQCDGTAAELNGDAA